MPPEVKRRRKRRSLAWEYFVPNVERTSAKCKLCMLPTEIKTPSGSTSALSRHLLTVHNIGLKTPTENVHVSTINPSEVISKMAAMDGIAFSTIANSTSIRHLFQLSGYVDIPTSGNGVRDCVLNFYELKKLELKCNIESLLSKGQKFSITLDEWTSTANRRYMNINLHGSEGLFWNLGLIRLHGSVTSEACKNYIRIRLQEYGIEFSNDIVCICTDGASVMTKLGRISSKPQQLCFAHGIHLAVVEVLYKKPKQESCEENINDEEFYEESLSSPFLIDDCQEAPPILQESFGGIIKKVRTIVKIFCKSPLKEEILKNYTRLAQGKELTLILDVKTRWNSLLAMLERFVLIKKEVLKTLIDIKDTTIVTEDEINSIEELVRVLKPIKIVVEALCKRDANLISCDVAVNFMLKKVKEKNSPLAEQMHDALRKRITERRTNLSEVLNYLHYGKTTSTNQNEYFQTIPRKQLIESIKDLLKQSIVEMSDNAIPESVMSESFYSQDLFENSLELVTNVQDLEEELYDALKLAQVDSNTNRITNFSNSTSAAIKKELALFDAGGSRGSLLEESYKMLMTIQPTSVESERAFSSANYLCSKTRSSLGDYTLNALVFLRSYFRVKSE